MNTTRRFLTETLRRHPQGQAVARILAAAVEAVEPGNAIRQHVRSDGKKLFMDGGNYSLEGYRRIHVLGLGKASYGMAAPLPRLLAGFRYRGLLITKHASANLDGFEQILGGHPVPDQNSLRAGEKALEFLGEVQLEDLLICLISGGGSALMTTPLPGITLEDFQSLTTSLLRVGARVDEINILRRHLDQLKGGGVAKRVSPAQVISLILSDVVGNPLEAIASGVTAPDPTPREEALQVLQKYGLTNAVRFGVLQALKESPETPKPGDEIFRRVHNILVGSNMQAAEAARRTALAEGFAAEIWGTDLQGEAREVAKMMCDALKEKTTTRPFCLIAGGETTVTVLGSGRGGRNQEFALACVEELSSMEDVMMLALATDGDDGPTDAAGALATDTTLERGKQLGLSPSSFLHENNSYAYFEALGDLLKPGPTGTNVNDLIFAFAL